MPRTYKNLPNPDTQIEEFNEYLLNNNTVINEGTYWILIQNSYISGQLVLFAKQPRKYLHDCTADELQEMVNMLADYCKHYMYINADHNKSVPNRLHIHIKLTL